MYKDKPITRMPIFVIGMIITMASLFLCVMVYVDQGDMPTININKCTHVCATNN